MVRYKKCLSLFLSLLLVLSLTSWAKASGEELFQQALAKYPLLKSDIPAKDYAKVLKIYGPAAQAGNIPAMGICAAILLKEKKWDKMYVYLAPLDAISADTVQFSEKDAAVVRKQLRLSSPDLLVGSMYKLLSQIHLLGLGTPQDYVKAQRALAQTTGIPKFALRNVPKKEDFAKPQSLSAQKAFWEYTRSVPGAEKFLLNRLILGEKGYAIESDLKRFVRYKNAEQELAFYEQHMSESLIKVFGYKIALLMLELKEFSPENVQKVRDILRVVANNDATAQELLNCLPKDLQDKERIQKLIQFYTQQNLLSKMPRWFFTYFTHQVDAGILDKTLPQKFSYATSPQEYALMTQYDAVQDKAAFLKALTPNFMHERLYAYKFHIFQDLAENHPELLKAYRQKMGGFALNYAPLRFYEGQRFHAQSLGRVGRKERARLELEARKDFEAASDAGYPPAMERHGYMLITSKDSRDKFKGFELILQAARMQHPKAILSLQLLPNNGGDAKAREKSLLTRAAHLGSAEAVRRLKALYKIDIPMDTKLYLADLVKNSGASTLSDEAKKLLTRGNTKEEIFLGAVVMQYVANKYASSMLGSAPLMGSLYYSGTVVPQNFDKAFQLYTLAYAVAPPKYKGDCQTVLPLTEMYLLGLGTEQDKAKAQQFMKTYPHCPAVWHKELAQKKIPTLKKSATTDQILAAGLAPRFEPSFKNWKSLSVHLTAEDMQKFEMASRSKQALLALLEEKSSSALAAGEGAGQNENAAMPLTRGGPVMQATHLSQNMPSAQAPAQAKVVTAPAARKKILPVAPQPKKPGLAVLMDESYNAPDRMGIGTFIPDQKPDSCLEVLAHAHSPLIAVRLESLGGIMVSWKTADVKTSALGALAVYQNDRLVNAGHASFALPVQDPLPLTLCVQDTQGALKDAKTRLRVIFYHENGSRTYAWVQK